MSLLPVVIKAAELAACATALVLLLLARAVDAAKVEFEFEADADADADAELEVESELLWPAIEVGGGNMSSGEGSSNTDDIGDKVGDGRKQVELPVFSWLGEIRVGVFRVAELERDVNPLLILVGVDVCNE